MRPALALAAILGVASCAGPPQPPPGRMLGVGTPGVSAFMPARQETSLQALVERCREVRLSGTPPAPQTLDAACDQLHRSMRNQPGNAVQGGGT